MALSRSPVVLALRALGVGDLLTGVPALRALRRAHPQHELVLAAPAALHPLVDLAAVADRVHPASGFGDLGWTDEPPALAVNLHGRGPQSSRLLAATAPRRLVAFASAEAGVDGPQWRPDEHEVRRWCRLLTEGLGVPADPADLDLSVPVATPAVRAAVVVHPGAAFPSRCWPAERFAAVARWAAKSGLPVVVTGSADESELVEEVAAGAGLPPAAVLAGKTTLLELAAVVSSARLTICGDTGIAHLATAYRRPSVVLFGPVAPSLWGPPPGGPHVAVWHGGAPGDPCGRHPDPALLSISVHEVIEAASCLLAHGASGSDPSGDVPLQCAGEAFV